jgi:fructosamine-3-kinase
VHKAFIKKNKSAFLDSFIKEAEGLKTLRKAFENSSILHIPHVFFVNCDTLQIEKIEANEPQRKDFEIFGKELAAFHKKPYTFYGYEEDNYIGLNPQKNIISHNWGEFFVHYRLRFQTALMKDDMLKSHFLEILSYHKQKIIAFLNENTLYPTLLHGDLWSGNVLFCNGAVWLIDPAVYYGDREVDIAMTEMFGGFAPEFYENYEKIYPKSNAYGIKKIIYNLYHYLNHYNLFGSAYLQKCKEGFDTIVEL